MLHLEVIEQAMDAADILRQTPIEDEYIFWVKLMGLRLFNGFASALNLSMTGYYQKSALVVRDLLETSWLIDLFRVNNEELVAWHTLSDAEREKQFKPWRVRKRLSKAYGTESKIRDQLYKDFCELAGHPTRKSAQMILPDEGGARNGPFFREKSLSGILVEMARVALQVSDTIGDFLNRPGYTPENWPAVYNDILIKRQQWMRLHYPGPPSSPY